MTERGHEQAVDRHDPNALAMDAVQKANAGHPGTAMALAPLAYMIYIEAMRTTTRPTPTWPGSNRFSAQRGPRRAC